MALGVLAAVALSCGAASATAALPPIKHVFIIVLENESKSTTFGPSSPAPYLAKTLTAQGAFVPNYYGIGHESNDNYIAMISGQAPNADNQADCQFFTDLQPGTLVTDGQAVGEGCVYPSDVPTIASQLQGAGLTWRDYDQSMGADPTREPAVCAHPALNSQDNTQSATASDQYATRHNPFVYFHGIIDDAASCNTHVVNLNLLPGDLTRPADTPNYVFITPDLCGDGHDATCADPSRPGGFAGIDQFLQSWVPRITSSPAYQRDGLLLIVFDEASTSDTSSCCGEMPGPGSPMPGVTGSGGGDVGAVLLSPFIAPGTVSQAPYNHYSMLRSVEDIFGLGHIGDAQLPGETSFGSDVFTRPDGPPPTGTTDDPPPPGVACVARVLPASARGRLAANTLMQSVRLVRGRRSAISLRAVHSAKLRIVATPVRGRPRTVASEQLQPCHRYTIGLPSGRGRVTISAAVGRGVQLTARHY